MEAAIARFKSDYWSKLDILERFRSRVPHHKRSFLYNDLIIWKFFSVYRQQKTPHKMKQQNLWRRRSRVWLIDSSCAPFPHTLDQISFCSKWEGLRTKSKLGHWWVNSLDVFSENILYLAPNYGIRAWRPKLWLC